MSLIVNPDRIPDRWADGRTLWFSLRSDTAARQADTVRIAFINNMPDPALEETELQFFELLSVAAGDAPVSVKLFSLPGILRTGRARERVKACYSAIEDLWRNRFDAAIITGTEPHQPELRNEPYWAGLADLFDWAAENTSSTVLSCLAAHASVLHGDGIERHLMREKCAGIFEVHQACDHPLLEGVPRRYLIPHSRWNEVREKALIASGYTVLTRSSEAGVDSFVKKKRNSLFVHFQGHPEYSAHTLLKEYRRDVKRFLCGERETYPSMPRGYFNRAASELLSEFQARALHERREEVLEAFPQTSVAAAIDKDWDLAARRFYGNWFRYLSARKVGNQRFASAAKVRRAAACGQGQRKRSAAS
jgi:homoserine O-succinyltransferase/O-acetyltransferase